MNLKRFAMPALLATVAVALFSAVTVIAQGPPPPPRDGEFHHGPPPPPEDGHGPPLPQGGDFDAHSRDLFQQVMVARLSKELDLNDEQTVLLVRRFLDYKDAGQKLRKERRDLMHDLRELTKDGDKNAAEIDAKLTALIASDQKISDSKRELYQKLSEGLAPVKKAKLYAFMQEFESELRRMADDVRGHRDHDGQDRGFGRGRGRDFGPGDDGGPGAPPPPPPPHAGPPPDGGPGGGPEDRGPGHRFRDHRGPGRPGGSGGSDGPGGNAGPPPPPPPPQRTPDDADNAQDPAGPLVQVY